MSTTLKGAGYLNIHTSSWVAVREIARDFGCTLEYEDRAEKDIGPGDYGEYVLEDSGRAFAKALYTAIRVLETDRASKGLVKLVKMASVGTLRDVADLAVVGRFYVD